MGYYRLTKNVDFCAAHSIKGAGKCERKHGHNWEANIEVECNRLNSFGFIADVAAIKHAAMKYDHDDLDNYFEKPTTEIVCKKIADDALDIVLAEHNRLDADLYVTVKVHLVETKNNSADFTVTYADCTRI